MGGERVGNSRLHYEEKKMAVAEERKRPGEKKHEP